MKFIKEIKIGIIVAVGIAALIWGVPFLKGSDIFSNYKRVIVVYNNVDGLTASSQVIINGFSIGQVEKVEFMPDHSGRLLVVLKIQGNVFVPKHSVARIVGNDLLGSKTVRLQFSTNKESIENKDTLIGEVESSITDELSQQLGPVKAKAENLIVSMDSVLKIVTQVLNKSTRENLISSVESIKHTLHTFENASIKLDSFVGDEKDRLSGIFKNVESISNNLQANESRITNVLQNFSNISDTLVKANIAATLNKANKTLAEVTTVMERINSGKGSMGMLVNDDSLYVSLSNSARNFDKLIVDLKEHPGRYVQLSIFGGRKR